MVEAHAVCGRSRGTCDLIFGNGSFSLNKKFSNGFILFFCKDCDMPEDFKVPANRPESVLVDAIDVASFLNLKRAKPLVVSKGNNDLSP